MSLMTQWDDLNTTVANSQADAEKAAKGNRTAATRLRKAMQEVKKQAQEIRVGALTLPFIFRDGNSHTVSSHHG